MEKFFKLKERGTDVKTEIMAGITTFMTMAYILAVNPGILSASGMAFGKVFSATAIASAIACLVMALLANLPFALSAGMGLNAFFAYTVCIGMGHSWQFALTAIFCEGIIFVLLTFFNIREAIVNSIPESLKKAIAAGIGLFIAFIGLQNAGIIVGGATLVELSASWFKGSAGVAMIGLVITAVLLALKVKGALLIGIVVTTIIGIPFGVTTYAGGSYLPDAPYFCNFAFKEIFASGQATFDFIVVMFTFLFIDMFDTVGTLIGCAGKSGLMNKDGTIPNCKEALFADAIGTTVGAVLGTSTVTTFVESASGVAEGGRTGLTALTVAVLFLLSLFLEPLFGSIPSAATAPALIIVGVMMITPVTEIDFNDFSEAIPAFLTILFMCCAYSISDGIMFGILSYVIIKACTGKIKSIPVTTWVVAALFVAKIIFKAIG
ncbi:MAG: NCS2 family permease [Spirochaetales bacterium]|nr:NCS2 family permease [Spirochaetales bacterium]MBR0520241.1 NCS2 family permease [Spirochaetales bacterium]